jgi:hypothetical protein
MKNLAKMSSRLIYSAAMHHPRKRQKASSVIGAFQHKIRKSIAKISVRLSVMYQCDSTSAGLILRQCYKHLEKFVTRKKTILQIYNNGTG